MDGANCATADATAVAGSDYSSTSGTLTIPTGNVTGVITVPVIGDAVLEPDETFYVNLSSPVNATLIDNQAWRGAASAAVQMCV